MKSEGIHRVAVPGDRFTAVMIVLMLVGLLAQWPSLRWLALGSLGVGFLVAAALIVLRRRSRGAPPAARLNFPVDERDGGSTHA